MGDLTIGGHPSYYDFTGNDPSSETVVYPSSGQSLADVARTLDVDPDALARANPSIGDANQNLSPNQEIRVPANLNPQWPKTHVFYDDDARPAGAQTSNTNLPPRPLGASDEATGMKARIQEAWQNVPGKGNTQQVTSATPASTVGVGAVTAVRTVAGSQVNNVKVLSPMYELGNHDFLVVQTSRGPQAFYRSTGDNSGMKGKWLPVDEFQPADGWLNKSEYLQGKLGDKNNPLHRVGNEEFGEISNELSDLDEAGLLPPGQKVPPGLLGENENLTANRILDFFGARQTPSTRVRPLPDPGEGPPDSYGASGPMEEPWRPWTNPGGGTPGASGGSGPAGGASGAPPSGSVPPASNVPSGPSAAAATEGGAAEAGLAGAGALEVLGFVGEIAGPILMMAQFAGTYGEAVGAKKQESYTNGFAQGMAAGVLGEPTDVVRGLGLPTDGSTAESTDRYLGAEGIPESYHNKGVGDGYKFFKGLPPEAQEKVRESLAAKGYNVKDKNPNNIFQVEGGLVGDVKDMFEKAQEAQRERIANDPRVRETQWNMIFSR